MSEDLTRAEALVAEGNRHLAAGAAAEAKACFLEAIRLAPELAPAHTNLGLLLDEEGRQAEAELHLRRALALNPQSGNTWLNLGVLLAGQKRFQEAEEAYRRALELIPLSPAAWSNLGVLQTGLKQEKEAEESYRHAMGLDPEHRLSQFNLGYLLLRQGRFEEGWRRLEARDWYAHLEKNLPCPRWRGESLQGKALIIGFEAGHGDMIQFCRYAAVLKARGAARITVICHPPLKTLFATMDGVDDAVAFDETSPPSHWDFWTPPLSMPFYCGSRLDTIPAKLPYLRAEQRLVERWLPLIAENSHPAELKVGLVWKGSRHFENDADRSLPDLKTLESLGSIEGVRFFSLQKGAGEDQAADPPHGLPVVNLGPEISDFADAAAVVSQMDLMICVDTAFAHLAGALAKRCWLLLPYYKTDWRWLAERSDSPWYPGVMRLFRQPDMGDWATVVTEVRLALQAFAADPSRRRGF